MPTRSSRFRSRRGAVLIVALLFAAIIGISLVSYMNVANNSLKQASRSFYANSAMNVAEIGLERAIACFNELDTYPTNPDLAWPSATWTKDSTAYNAASNPTTPWAKATFSSFNLGPGASGSVKLYVHHYRGSTQYDPKIVAKAIVEQTDAPAIEKYVEVTLRKRSLFANGLVAKDNINWSGKPVAGSYNSDPTGTGSPLYDFNESAPVDQGGLKANITVGSLRGDIGLSGGTVWGYAKTGPTGSIDGGSVHGLGTSVDDPTRRTNDFNATFPTFGTPVPSTSKTVAANVGPGTKLGASDNLGGGAPALCSAMINNNAGTYYFYVFDAGAGINLNTDKLTIDGNVVIILNNHTATTSISVTGSASLEIPSGSSLNVFTNGNVNIAGNGLVNTGDQPKNCFFWGTRTTDGQTFTIAGNGTLKAVIYAPNAVVTLDGGGASSKGYVLGSVVAKEINMNGNTEFYYDESLAKLTTGNPWGISKWKELQSESERAAYSTLLNF